jgi:hypothetical protein
MNTLQNIHRWAKSVYEWNTQRKQDRWMVPDLYAIQGSLAIMEAGDLDTIKSLQAFFRKSSVGTLHYFAWHLDELMEGREHNEET